MSNDNILYVKAKQFAIRIVKLYSYLRNDKQEFVISKQVLRSGTSIGANIAESEYGQSNADFINKLSIARKEGAETLYWIELLHDTGYIQDNEYSSIMNDCQELMKIMTTSIKTLRWKSKK